jgi:hypothetical protein
MTGKPETLKVNTKNKRAIIPINILFNPGH